MNELTTSMAEPPSLDLVRQAITDPHDPSVLLEEHLRAALAAMEPNESLMPRHLVKAVSMGAPLALTASRTITGQTAFLYTVTLRPVFYAVDYAFVFVRNDQAELSYLAANSITPGMLDRPYYADASWSILASVRAILRANGLTITKCSSTYNRAKAVAFHTTSEVWNRLDDKDATLRLYDRLVADYHAITYLQTTPAEFTIVADNIPRHTVTFA